MPSSVFRAVKSAIFYVEDRGDDTKSPIGSLIVGTAFVVDSIRGFLATAAHVVEGMRPSRLRLRTVYGLGGSYALGTPHKVSAYYLHPDLDLAIIATSPSATKDRPTFQPGNADVGDAVAIVGYAFGTQLVWVDDILGRGSPKSITPVQSHGHIAARVPDDGIQPLQVYAYDSTTYPGQSGSPVIGVDGHGLLAVHTHGFRGSMGYGVAVDSLFGLLADIDSKSIGATPEPNVLGDFECSPDPAPSSRHPEKDLKIGGKMWRIIKNDVDPLPSNPHAHLLGSRYKLHLGTGELFQRSKVVGRISKSELDDLREKAVEAGITLPAKQ